MSLERVTDRRRRQQRDIAVVNEPFAFIDTETFPRHQRGGRGRLYADVATDSPLYECIEFDRQRVGEQRPGQFLSQGDFTLGVGNGSAAQRPVEGLGNRLSG